MMLEQLISGIQDKLGVSQNTGLGLVPEIREEYCRALSYSAIVSSVRKNIINISGQTCFASFPA